MKTMILACIMAVTVSCSQIISDYACKIDGVRDCIVYECEYVLVGLKLENVYTMSDKIRIVWDITDFAEKHSGLAAFVTYDVDLVCRIDRLQNDAVEADAIRNEILRRMRKPRSGE